MDHHVSHARAAALAARMQQLGVDEADLRESFVRGAGSGGQKINKTSSCVRLLHVPSGIEIRCQQQRSQAWNRHLARAMLCDRLESERRRAKASARAARERERRRRRGRPEGVKRKMIQDRMRRSKVKQLRRKPVGD